MGVFARARERAGSRLSSLTPPPSCPPPTQPLTSLASLVGRHASLMTSAGRAFLQRLAAAGAALCALAALAAQTCADTLAVHPVDVPALVRELGVTQASLEAAKQAADQVASERAAEHATAAATAVADAATFQALSVQVPRQTETYRRKLDVACMDGSRAKAASNRTVAVATAQCDAVCADTAAQVQEATAAASASRAAEKKAIQLAAASIAAKEEVVVAAAGARTIAEHALAAAAAVTVAHQDTLAALAVVALALAAVTNEKDDALAAAEDKAATAFAAAAAAHAEAASLCFQVVELKKKPVEIVAVSK